jgi:superkiller protein 3
MNYLQLGKVNESDKTDSKAVECVRNSVNLEKSNHSFWNSLGVCYVNEASKNDINEDKRKLNNEIAQHCFIKSIQLNDNDAIAWTNLGVFYLIHNEIELAHRCFQRAQSIDPEYTIAWIGQVY